MSGGRPANAARSAASYSFTTPPIGSSSTRIPSASARAAANRRLSSEVNSDGIVTPWTASAPSASTATHATSDESMPPLRPTTTPRKPFFRT